MWGKEFLHCYLCIFILALPVFLINNRPSCTFNVLFDIWKIACCIIKGRGTPQTTTSPPVSDDDSEEELADNELTVVDEVSTTRENDDGNITSPEKLVTPLDTPLPAGERTPVIQATPAPQRKSDTPETQGATTSRSGISS